MRARISHLLTWHSVQRQRQEDARLIRCDAEQQRRNELGKGYDRLRAALNRGDERLSKARVVERGAPFLAGRPR